MDFAKKHLEKYGWTEGKGLGKHGNGIAVPIKPKLKFDKAGVGHDYGKEYCEQWWADLYNKSASKIKVDIESNFIENTDVIPSNEESDMSVDKNKNSGYNNFVKTAKLTKDGLVSYTNIEDVQKDPKKDFFTQELTDEELFLACGGRTAHKGARHGLKLSGKLARIEKQEKLLAKQLQKISFQTSQETCETLEKKMKKIQKYKTECPSTIVNDTSGDSKKKKSKKKKRKSVSFNETVIEYHTQDLDTSSQSNDSAEPPIILEAKIKEESNEPDLVDEGIEVEANNDGKGSKFRKEDVSDTHFPKKKKKSKKNKGRDEERPEESILLKVCKRKKCKEDEAKLALEGTRKKRKQIIEEQMVQNMSECLDQVCRISESE